METLSLFSELDDAALDAALLDGPQSWRADRIDQGAMAARASEIVGGLDYLPDYISRDEERRLLRHVDSRPWSTHWQRRTQYYGRRYLPADSADWADGLFGYANTPSNAHLPWWVSSLEERLWRDGTFARMPNQMGINEYLPGQGIAPHVDYHGGEVVSITLGAGCLMDFSRADGCTEASMWLAPRSIVVLKGDARMLWRHGIARRKRDIVDGLSVARGRRVSVTFRYVA
jgi:alkylated DNA repair dioxygenase AlkB